MLPNTGDFDDLLDFEETEQEKTQTFGIASLFKKVTIRYRATLGECSLGYLKLGNTDVDQMIGKIDGLEALRQSLYLLLAIEADQYLIYPHTYGVNTLDLIGKPYYYVLAVLPDRIKETLMSDHRVVDVSDFEFKVNKNKITVQFVVYSIYGNVEMETEVTY